MGCVRQLQCFVYLILIIRLLPTALASSSTSLPGCPDKCGNITIPYPFGIRTNCYRDNAFQITCNESNFPPRAIIGSGSSNNIELIDINITTGEARAHIYIGFVCYDQSNHANSSNTAWIDLTVHPAYLFSNRRNKFTAIGCDIFAYIYGERNSKSFYQSGCVSTCESLNTTTGDRGSCNGLGCCQTAIPAGLDYYKVGWDEEINSAWRFNPCNYAMLVEDDRYKFQVQDLTGFDFYNSHKGCVPIVLDWAIRFNGTCQGGVENSTNPACLSNHSICNNTSNGEGYLCQCKEGYEGNPYLPKGCIGN